MANRFERFLDPSFAGGEPSLPAAQPTVPETNRFSKFTQPQQAPGAPDRSLVDQVGFAASRVGTAVPNLAKFVADTPQHLGALAQFGVSGEQTGVTADAPSVARSFDEYAAGNLGAPDFTKYPAQGYDPAKLREAYKTFQALPQNADLAARSAAARIPEAYKGPMLGSDILASQLRAAAEGIKDVTGGNVDLNRTFREAETPAEQVVEGVVEGITTGGTSLPRAAVRAAIPSIGKRVTAAEAEALRREIVADLITGGVGGYTGTVAAQNAPEGWELPAGLAGGIAGGVGAVGGMHLADAATRSAGDYLRPAIPTKGNVERLASDALKAASSDPAAAAEAIRTAKAPEGVRYTAGQAAGDTGLLNLEQTLARGKDQEFREAMIDRAAEQNRAIVENIRRVEENGSPAALSEFFTGRMGDLTARAAQLNANAKRLAEADAAGLEAPEAAEVGGGLQDALEAEMGRVREEIAALDRAIDPTGTMQLPTQALRTTVNDTYAKMSPEERLSITPEERALIDIITKYGDALPYDRFRDLRTQINEDMRNARTAGKGRAYGRMSQLRGALETDIKDAISGRFSREASAADNFVRQAREWYETRVGGEARPGAAPSAVGAPGAGARAVSEAPGAGGARVGETGAAASDPRLPEDAAARRAVEGGGRYDQGEIIQLGPRREQKQLEGFHRDLMSQVGEKVAMMREATRAAREKGVFEGFNVGDRLRSQNVEGKTLPPMKIEGLSLRAWKGDKGQMAPFERMGIKPTIVEYGGQQYVPMARVAQGDAPPANLTAKQADEWEKANLDKEWSRFDTYLDLVRDRPMRGPQKLFQSDVPEERGPAFYSAALKSVEDSKTNRASPQQWAATIKNTPGVKQEELDWLGLPGWLAQQKGAVTKEQVADYIRANQIEVEEVDLSGESAEQFEADLPRRFDWEADDIDEDFVREVASERAAEEADDYRERVARNEDIEPEEVTDEQIEELAFEDEMRFREQEPDGYHTSVTVDTPDGSQTTYDINRDSSGYTNIYNADLGHVADGDMDEGDIRSRIAQHLEESFEKPDGGEGADGPTQYGDYTLPGGENYTELLLKLPERQRADDTRPSAEVQAKYGEEWGRLSQEYDRLIEAKRALESRMPVNERFNSQEYIDARDAARETRQAMDALHAKMVEETRASAAPWKQGENFDAPHYDDQSQNILAHVRFKDRTSVDGKKTLFLEEVQSDWHQQGRDKGYGIKNTPENKAKLRDLEAASNEALDASRAAQREAVGRVSNGEFTVVDELMNAMSLGRTMARHYGVSFDDLITPPPPGRVARGDVPSSALVEKAMADPDVVRGIRAARMRESLIQEDGLKRAQEAARVASEAHGEFYRQMTDGVPDAPFKTTWPELALKRMIRWAADNGYDQVAWTPGSVQNKRYNLSQHVDEIEWNPMSEAARELRRTSGDAAADATRVVSLNTQRRGTIYLFTDADGKVIQAPALKDAIGKPLSEVIGKDLSSQIMADTEGRITKQGLAELGGSGMREFYDRVLVSLGNKLGKKFGTQVGKTELAIPRGGSDLGIPAGKNLEAAALPITPEMRAGALRGQPLFQKVNEAATSPLNDRPQPTAAQKEAGNYKKGRVRLGGLDISIENPAGSKRSGTGADGKPWSVDLKDHYGYVKGSVGKDKDHVDVFVSRDAPSDLGKESPVFVVNQIDPKTGRFDEWKVMLGYPDVATARAAYLRNYAPGWRGLGTIAETNLADFKTLIGRGFGKSPLKGRAGAAPSKQASPLSRVVEYDGSGAKPEQSSVPQLRWEGHQLVGRNDELQRLPVGDRGNRGSPQPGASVGPEGQRRELLSRQSAMGDQARAGSQYAEEPPTDGGRRDVAAGSMGGARESGAFDDSLSSRAGNVGRAGRQPAGAVQRTGGVDAQGSVGAGGVRPVSGAAASPAGNAGRQADGSLRGLPQYVRGDVARNIPSFKPSAYPDAQRVAASYMKSTGLEYRPPNTYVKVDPERATRIASAYDEMKHDPANPEVKRAYKAMADETLAQYQAMLDDGVEIEFIAPGQADPYAGNPRNMTEDVRKNKHMWVFATRDGFGSDATFDVSDNPLLGDSGFEISGQPATINDIFRAVHDYFGHVKEGVGFRADGEENAWRAHSAMYSPEARRAMTSETRGQNSWVNYGPHGEKNRTAKSEDTHYADQKIGLLPEWVAAEGAGDDTIATTMAQRFARAGRPEREAQAAGHLVDAFYTTLAGRTGKSLDEITEKFPLPRVRNDGEKITGLPQEGRRGQIELGRGKNPSLISMFEKADASTAIHESAHQFLDMFQRVAGDSGAPEALRKDWSATRAWWEKNATQLAKDAGEGVTPDDVRKVLRGGSLGAKDAAVARGMHEQWARAFEVYLRDGKAPNAAMKGVFEQFKDWLTQVYQSLAGMNVNVSKDIRGVFDRMLTLEQSEPTAPGSMIDAASAKRLSDVTGKWKDFYGTYSDKGANPVPAIVKRSKGETYPHDMPAENVTKAVWRPGPEGAAAIRNVLKAAGSRRDAVTEGVEQSAMLSLARLAMKDGVVDPAKFDAWKAKHSDALRLVPGIAQKMGSAADATREMQRIAAVGEKAVRDVQKTAVGDLLKLGPDASDADVSRKVGSMMERQGAVKTMRELVDNARSDPDALAGLRRAVVDHVLHRFGRDDDRMVHQSMRNWVSRNRAALSEVLEPEQMSTINAIMEASERITKKAVAPLGGSPTAEYLSALEARGESPSMLAAVLQKAMGNAVQSGIIGGIGHIASGMNMGVGINSAIAAFLSKAGMDMLRSRGFSKADALLREAILDPALARALLMKAPKRKAAGAAKELERALSAGVIGLLSGNTEADRRRNHPPATRSEPQAASVGAGG